MTNSKTLDEYLKLPYSIVLTPSDEDDGGWLAEIPALPGCFTFGDTPAEALEMIEDAKRLWLTYHLEAGLSIPEPQPLSHIG